MTYRKNETWDIISFTIFDHEKLGKYIKQKVPKNADIIDVKLTTIEGQVIRVDVFYALI